MHRAPFHAGPLLDLAELGNVSGEMIEHLDAQIGVGDLAAPECNGRLDLVAFLQEPQRMIFLELVVVVVGIGTELDFLDLDFVLLLFRLVLAFFFLVGVLAVVDYFGDRRYGRRRNENEIKPHLLGPLDPDRRRQDFRDAIGEYNAALAGANEVVDVIFADPWGPPEWSTNKSLLVAAAAAPANRLSAAAFGYLYKAAH